MKRIFLPVLIFSSFIFPLSAQSKEIKQAEFKSEANPAFSRRCSRAIRAYASWRISEGENIEGIGTDIGLWPDLVQSLETSPDRDLLLEPVEFGKLKNGRRRRIEGAWEGVRETASVRIRDRVIGYLGNFKAAGVQRNGDLGESIQRLDAARRYVAQALHSGIYNAGIMGRALEDVAKVEERYRETLVSRDAKSEQAKLIGYVQGPLLVQMHDRPHLFSARLLRATEESGGFRAFAAFQFDRAREHPLAGQMAQAANIRLLGDPNGGNAIVNGSAKWIDLDDYTRGPASLDSFRAMTWVMHLYAGPQAGRMELIERYNTGYRTALSIMDPRRWARAVAGEPAIQDPFRRKKDWRNAGIALMDEGKAEAIKKAVGSVIGRNLSNWDVRLRWTAGGGSIGGEKYVLVNQDGTQSWSLKQLWAVPAPTLFTLQKDTRPHGKRVREAYQIFRNIVSGLEQVVTFGGSSWVLRKREPKEFYLGREDLGSAAFVLGGMVALAHAAQIKENGRGPDRRDLLDALEAVSPQIVLWSADLMALWSPALTHFLQNSGMRFVLPG